MEVITDTQTTSPQVSSSPEYVRQCGICHKPFLKESSFNRHVSYCRRTRNRPRTRARACQSCNLAKVKCSLEPQCQRCTSRGIDCIYDPILSIPISASNKSGSLGRPHIHPGTQTQTSPAWLTSEVASHCGQEPSTTPYSREPLDDTYMEWDMFNIDAPEIMIPSPPKSSLPCLPESLGRPGELMTDNHEVLDFRDTGFNPQNLLPADLPWSMEGGSRALARTVGPSEYNEHLSPIPKSDPFSNYTAKVVMQMLRAFPQMMLRRETLPPFIHGYWSHLQNSADPNLPQPVLNSMGIAQVFAARSAETKSFLWRMIQTEQSAAMEKAEKEMLPKRDLLASIQAQLIYLTMRITDNSTTEPGLNFELLSVFQRLCEKLKSLCNQPFFQQELHNPSSNWEDWIFAESRRRTAVVWLLITQMVHIKIGVPCDSFPEYREIPLPAPRSVWEARTRVQWQAEFETYKNTPRMGMETVGHLITASQQSDSSMNKMRLDIWNAGTDNLGLLLNMAVAMM